MRHVHRALVLLVSILTTTVPTQLRASGSDGAPGASGNPWGDARPAPSPAARSQKPASSRAKESRPSPAAKPARQKAQPARPAPAKPEKAARAPRAAQPAPVLRDGVSPPLAGETRFRASEILVVVAAGQSDAAVDAILRRHRLTEVAAAALAATGETWRLWRAGDGRSTRALVRQLAGETALARLQPNYVYTLAAEAAAALQMPQYARTKLRADTIDAAADGDGIVVAIVDSAIDETHPDLAGAVADRYDAIGSAAPPHPHGTAIAGAVAGHGAVQGLAPRAKLLAVSAFEPVAKGAQGATFAILKGVDWALGAQARVVNMSFAGPADPALADLLAIANRRRVLLVAAAGNAGAKSPPLYPAALPFVIAVAATDAADALYARSVRGAHVRLAAPGVDVLLPAPGGRHDLETGTSVAAAFASGLAALVAQRDKDVDSRGLRDLFERTARPLAATGGVGLIDALGAVARKDAAK